jgi:hypothetical protein
MAKQLPSCREHHFGKKFHSRHFGRNFNAESPPNLRNNRVWPKTGCAPLPVKALGGTGRRDALSLGKLIMSFLNDKNSQYHDGYTTELKINGD